MIENGRNHGRRSRFAMAAGHSDAIFEPHQLGQHLAARDHRKLQTTRFLHFRIVLVDRRTHHHRLRPGHICRRVPLVDGGAKAGQPLRHRAQFDVGSADDMPQIEQHLGDAAHADSADSDEMEVLPAKKHFNLLLFRLLPPLST